ncbi:MAG TPA: hypothetical protein PK430_04785 [Muribaculum sp.]|uniref:DUF3592 domain-containing protein n=1 Tax=Heminiphilus faecis TaxID=2601703 RepID=A0ABV4CTV7_9BACT|nr:hypothetical protein [Heminiphilus faecis]RLT76976.1 hypothetical protein D7V95_05590 [bacterium J10(2018)]HRF68520.1 hypothetical protein [Muribaculum sp.]
MSRKNWRIFVISVVMVIVLFILGLVLRMNYEERELEKGSCDISGVVEKVTRHHTEESTYRVNHRLVRRPASTSYKVYYYYIVDGDTLRGNVSTTRPMLRRVGAGARIPVTYALSNPEIHRAHTDRMTVKGGHYVFGR